MSHHHTRPLPTLILFILSAFVLSACATGAPESASSTAMSEPQAAPETPSSIAPTVPQAAEPIAQNMPESPSELVDEMEIEIAPNAPADGITKYSSRNKAEWRELLSPQQYHILWEKGTERAFSGDHKPPAVSGTYVTAGCRIPVFHTDAQYDSGTGWPSFFEPIQGSIMLEEDNTLFATRTEVLSACGEHLGHVFDDGPAPTGKRYCINSAALIFVPDTTEVVVEAQKEELATFAGGCFWCMESPFEKLAGVTAVISGYAGGVEVAPTYEEVSSGSTGHVESVQVTFDPSVISYEQLLEVYWRQINPTDNGGQFVDRGYQYTSAIFVHSESQRIAAENSRNTLETSNVFRAPIVTPITNYTTFYPAEAYHQDYYKVNPLKYNFYRSRSGRDAYLDSIWGKEE